MASRKRALGPSKSALNTVSKTYGSNSVGDYQDFEQHRDVLKQQELQHKLD